MIKMDLKTQFQIGSILAVTFKPICSLFEQVDSLTRSGCSWMGVHGCLLGRRVGS